MVQTRRKKAEQQEGANESVSPQPSPTPPPPAPIKTGRRGRPSKTKNCAPASEPIAEVLTPKPPEVEATPSSVHTLEKEEEFKSCDLVLDESRASNDSQPNEDSKEDSHDVPIGKNQVQKLGEHQEEAENSHQKPLNVDVDINEISMPPEREEQSEYSPELDGDDDDTHILPAPVVATRQSDSMDIDSEDNDEVTSFPSSEVVSEQKTSFGTVFEASAFDVDNVKLPNKNGAKTQSTEPAVFNKREAIASPAPKVLPKRPHIFHPALFAFQPVKNEEEEGKFPPMASQSEIPPMPPLKVNTHQSSFFSQQSEPGTSGMNTGDCLLNMVAPPPPPPPGSVGLSPSTPFQMQIKPIQLKNQNVRCNAQNALLFSPTKRGTLFGSPAKNMPPPSVVEPPKLSFFASPPKITLPPPPPQVVAPVPVPEPPSKFSAETIKELRQKAQTAAERISRRVEEARTEQDKRKEERDRRYRRNEEFYHDDRRVRDREKEKQEAIRRAALLAKEHREERKHYEQEKHHHRHDHYQREKSHYEEQKPFQSTSSSEIPLPPSPAKPPAVVVEEKKEPSTSAEKLEEKVEPSVEMEVEEEKEEPPAEKENEKEDIIPEHERVVPPYEIIGECKYLTKNSTKKKTESLICDCYQSGHNCSDNRCVNRAMLTECPPSCPSKCKNQRFTKRKYAAVEAFHTGTKKGCGLRALKDIKKGQFIIEYVGEMLERDDYEKRKQKYAADKTHKHHYLCDTGNYTIDATSMGNPSRFINHSCEPNAVCEKWSVPKTPGDVSRIGFFAKRQISEGEEITFDYQFVNYGRDAQACYCGTSSCTGWIGEKPEDDSDEDEDSDEELVTTREIEEDEEDHRLSELGMMTEEARKAEIEEMMADLILRNRKHAKRIIKIGERMTDADQIIELIDGIFSQDMPIHVQLHYAKEGMTTLMYEWLSQDNFSVSNLKLMQKVLQTLHGEVFVSCARSDRDLVDLVARMAKLGDLPEGAAIQMTMESMVTFVEAKTNDKYEEISENVYNDVEANFHRLREMAVRLNHHWFNRSVNFRIPKKVREPEVISNHSSKDEDKAMFSPALSCSESRYDQESRYYPSHTNKYQSGRYHDYNNSHPYSRKYHDYSSRPREFFPDTSTTTMRRRYPAHQYETTFFNPSRKRYRRSRSRSRSVSPFKRRRADEYEKSRRTPEKKSPYEVYDKEMPSSSSSNLDRSSRPEAANRLSAAMHSASTASLSNTSLPSVQHVPPSSYHMPYEYGMYDPNSGLPYPYYFPQPTPPAGYHDYMHPHYPAWPPKKDDEEEVEEVRKPLTLKGLPSISELHVLYLACTAEELNARYAVVAEEQKLIQRRIVEMEFLNKTKAAAAAAEKKAESQKQQPQPQQQMYGTPDARSSEIREPPPKPDRYLWARAKTDGGDTYYYHKVTKKTQWSPPRPEQGELDPNDMTPPDTTEESINSSEHDEKSRVPSSLSARVGEIMEGPSNEADTVVQLNSHQQREAIEREKSLHRLSEAQMKAEEQRRQQDHMKKAFHSALEKIIAPIVYHNVRKVKTASPERTRWLIKLVVKEMYKRESQSHEFNFTLTETKEKMVRKYTESLMERKLKNGAVDIWKGYKPS